MSPQFQDHPQSTIFLRCSCDARQDDPKNRAAVYLGLVLKRPAVFLDNARGDGKAQSSAGVLGGEKRVEQSLFDLGSDAFAGVGDLKDHDLGRTIGQPFGVGERAQGYRATMAYAVGGVLDEIDQN